MKASGQKKRSKSGQKAAIHAAASSDESQIYAPASPLASVTQPTRLDPTILQQFSLLLQEFTIVSDRPRNNESLNKNLTFRLQLSLNHAYP